MANGKKRGSLHARLRGVTDPPRAPFRIAPREGCGWIKTSMKGKRIARGLVALAVLTVSLVAIANVYDYFAFRSALARVEQLTDADKLEIGDFYLNAKTALRFSGEDSPAPLKRLKPVKGNISPRFHDGDVLLYERGEIYLWLRIATSPNNQQILYFTNSARSQKARNIWHRNPEFIRRVSPSGRRATVSRWDMSDCRRWIVLDDRIMVVDVSGRSGGEDIIQATAKLEPEGLRQILELIDSTKKKAGGMDFRTEGMDGLQLYITFNPDGSGGQEGISISNAQVPEVTPLLDLISQLGPKEYPIEFDRIVSQDDRFPKAPIIRRSLREREKLDWPEPKTPWWCVWRKLVY
ncbi:MAG: hypothetical protein NTV51_06375 [Verrucomicrobia bacterium]|nr:hypothetical protein [Verrucomicrobiota bacterium]